MTPHFLAIQILVSSFRISISKFVPSCLTDKDVSGKSTELDTKVYQVYNLWTHKMEGKTSVKNKIDRKVTVKSRDVISYRLIIQK